MEGNGITDNAIATFAAKQSIVIDSVGSYKAIVYGERLTRADVNMLFHDLGSVARRRGRHSNAKEHRQKRDNQQKGLFHIMVSIFVMVSIKPSSAFWAVSTFSFDIKEESKPYSDNERNDMVFFRMISTVVGTRN